MSNNNTSERQRLGGLWKRESKSGNKYLTGKINVNGQDVSLVVFATKEKRNEKSPDYVVYLSEDARPQQNSGGTSNYRNSSPQRSNNPPQRRQQPQQNNTQQAESEDFI